MQDLLDSTNLSERTWLRPTLLLLVTFVLAVVSPGVLVAIPFLFLALVLGVNRFPVVTATFFAMVITLGMTTRDSIWYLERGWAFFLAGCFVALTMYWPRSRFFPRAIGAVLCTFIIISLLLSVRPGSWTMVDWIVTDGIMKSVGFAMSIMTNLNPDVDIPDNLLNAVFETADRQGRLFPAFLGLSSLAGLGVAWWGYVRLALGSDQGLGPLKSFSFNDNLVWLFIIGLALIVFGLGDVWTRIGLNTVVFMSGLYAMRGAAVFIYFNGGISFLASLAVALCVLLLAPIIVMGMIIIGVGDTWFNLRAKAEAFSGNIDS